MKDSTMKNILYYIISFCFLVIYISPVLATPKEAFSFSASDYYQKFVHAIESQNYKWAEYYGTTLLSAYPKSQFSTEVCFAMGKMYFAQQKLDLANSFFSECIKKEEISKNFNEIFKYKLQIAQEYERGVKRPLFQSKLAPNWSSGKDESLQICEEIITSLPKDNLAAEALFCKSQTQLSNKKYQDSIHTLEKLIDRFPNHSLALEGYIQIGKIYLLQTSKQFPDPDHLELAKINLDKMQTSFPDHPKVQELKELFNQMESLFAERLFIVAKHYDLMKKPESAAIYYTFIIQEYPNTEQAKVSKHLIDTRQK